MIRTIQFVIGIVLLISIEVLRVYFIMPFPGSQRSETISLAYFVHTNIFYFRTIGLLIILLPAFYFLWFGKPRVKVASGSALLCYVFIFYVFNYRFSADKMFYQPQHKTFVVSAQNKVNSSDLVIGVEVNDESKAYPIQIIGYHHQVRDTVGNVPVMITYCTVCRTGRVYRPEIDGHVETFRLVGMDHFNAMFEDETSGSWWRQVNGEAIEGPLKGKFLTEVPSQQMTLSRWLVQHPASLVMQPDSIFTSEYEDLEGFNKGTIKSSLEQRDSLSWKDKSWVVGVQLGLTARAYDWNDLLKSKVINDTLQGTPIVIVIEPDSASFHVWQRDTLTFQIENGRQLLDRETNSLWDWSGTGTAGPLEKQQLHSLQSYQEFWHSWKTFHPQTTRFHP